jgi:hypothetical protein
MTAPAERAPGLPPTGGPHSSGVAKERRRVFFWAMKQTAACLTILILCGCAARGGTSPPPLYTEHTQQSGQPAAYMRPADELEQQLVPSVEPITPSHQDHMKGHSAPTPGSAGH